MAVVVTRERGAAFGLDDVSKAIIEQLQQDGRRPYAAIGKAVGLSEAAVRQRVQRLIESGVMQIVAVTDPLQVGFPRAAMIGVRVDGDVEIVADTAGRDARGRLRGRHRGRLRHPRRGGVRGRRPPARRGQPTSPGRARGRDHTETFVYLKLRKQIYTWGTR